MTDRKKSPAAYALFIAGLGRNSVATVAQAIDPVNRYRDMFEPFNKHEVYASRSFNGWLYLRPGDSAARYLTAAEQVISGRLRHPFVDRWNSNKEHKKRLIRETKANLWLGWLRAKFPDLTTVLVLRHPCTVASGSVLLERMDRFAELIAQPDLLQDHLLPFREILACVKDKFDKYVFSWCIQHYVPLRQFSGGKVCLVFYESLCAQPEAEIAKLTSFLRRSFDGDLPEDDVSRFMQLKRKGALLDPWRKHLTTDQVRRTVEILQIFGLDEIYSEDTMPDVDGAYRFMSRSAK